MTGIERSLKTLNFQKTDRVPILGGWILHSKFFEKITGAKNFWDNPKEIALQAYRKLGTDAIVNLLVPYSPQEFRSIDEHGLHSDMKKYKSLEGVIEYIKNLPSPETLDKNFNFEKAYQNYIEYVKKNQRDMEDMLWLTAGHSKSGQSGRCRYNKR